MLDALSRFRSWVRDASRRAPTRTDEGTDWRPAWHIALVAASALVGTVAASGGLGRLDTLVQALLAVDPADGALRTLPALLAACAALLPFGLAFSLLTRFGARAGVPALIGLALGWLLLAAALLRFGWWLPPGAAWLGLVLAYPLWRWRRLELALTALGERFGRLPRDPLPWPLRPVPDPRGNDTGSVEADARVETVQRAMDHVADWRRLLSDSLDALPDIALVTDALGLVLLANSEAARYFGASLTWPLVGRHVAQLLVPLEPCEAGRVRDWLDLLDPSHLSHTVDGIEVRDADDRRLLVKCAPYYSGRGAPRGWILSLLDVTHLRQAELARDEALRFLSHDMRAPQAALLALIDLQRRAAGQEPDPAFLDRMEQYARVALSHAEGFVQLAKAEVQPLRFAEEDLGELLRDALDAVWTLARHKRITLDQDDLPDDALVLADRSHLTRALTNLLSNAVKYSPADTTVRCRILRDGARWCCEIADQGQGIAPADLPKLFQRFARLTRTGQQDAEAVGLGLALVKTVVDRHGGEITVDSVLGQGSCFRLWLPVYGATSRMI